MGAAIGSDKKKRDIEIAVVPFIDLMSCLTAFLLVTAVWSTQAQIDSAPVGNGLNGRPPETIDAVPSILVTAQGIRVGTPGSQYLIDWVDGSGEWDQLTELLASFLEEPGFDANARVEIAADDAISYQHVVSAMDATIASGFRGVTYLDPASLSVQF